MKKILICLLVGTLLLVGCTKNKETEESGNKNNETEEINEVQNEKGMLPDKEVNGLKFTNASISYVDDVSTFVGNVKNSTSNTMELGIFEIILKDKNGDVISTLPAYVSDTIKSDETKQIIATISMDLTNAYDVEYKF